MRCKDTVKANIHMRDDNDKHTYAFQQASVARVGAEMVPVVEATAATGAQR
jgi:hypothetical protein